MSFLKKLPAPKMIEELDFNSVLNDVKKLFKSYLNDDEIELLESDRFAALLEVIAYRELLLRARINEAVKSMLLGFAKESDLDNVVAIYGIERLKGEKPHSSVKFTLSSTRESNTLIPKGTILVSDDAKKAMLKDDVIIAKGELEAEGKMILNEFVKESKVKCEFIQTPFPFVLKAKQLSGFDGGTDAENDERLRERAILSLERFSTAGAKKAYIYQAMSATPKVEEVSVSNGGAGVVNVFLKTTDMSENTREEVATYLNAERRRPLTDNVVVKNATINEITIRAELELHDMFMQDEIDKNIKENKKSLSLGEDLNLSYVYKILHTSGVYRVNLSEPSADIKISDDSFVRINYELSYTRAKL
ncbi:phage baseplate assembly protein J, putative [Campylobacter pinnipediorum subsp. caledonicus]|uniref:Phage baseplate assembly protein J, putative n=1 Tax=Campylobacter pinnipediorum subsp. caledonicus TaxID=1874362 RepID=A0A1S6U878_9BACT|nr:baseplate J/gp47 family protein [Campylobacter pinnipediorum]AQW85487.1 phage baseplate assembly protein J, putative [Campylobacter pinnipediorum subsp. caledonicus]AQW87899.1 phage baseplate assembly protein J, putative [Campylobacter pinnipediorum subsp. caledonicus]